MNILIYNKETDLCSYKRLNLVFPTFKYKKDKVYEAPYEMGEVTPETNFVIDFPTTISYCWHLDGEYKRIQFIIFGFGIEYYEQNGF